jgi:hypothetical protein
MKRTPLRPGSPPVRKTGLRGKKPLRSGSWTAVATAIAKADRAHRDEGAAEARQRKTRREQIQRMERFGTYAWLIRVLPCAGCYPTMYRGSVALERTVAAFAEYATNFRMRQSEAAHLKSVGAGGLADGNLLPLCANCHRLGDSALHFIGPSAFANRIGLPLAITAEAIAATPQGKALLSIDKRAAKALRDLTVVQVGPRTWHVTGGQTPGGHVVTRNAGFEPCRCPFAHSHPSQVCKHRIAVRLYEGARLETVLREAVAAELPV